MTHRPIQLHHGDDASPLALLQLAAQYRAAAEALLAGGRLHWAPFRLCALQGLELSLAACLRHLGEDEGRIRDLGHDLRALLERARAGGLALDRRTADHVASLMANRQSAIARYACVASQPHIHPHALLASLKTVERAATDLVAGDSAATPLAARA